MEENGGVSEIAAACKKQNQWYEEQLDRECELMKHIETTREMARLEDLNAKGGDRRGERAREREEEIERGNEEERERERASEFS